MSTTLKPTQEVLPGEDRPADGKLGAWLPLAFLFSVAFLVGIYGVNSTGPLWPDGPRYANAGAMVHDWLLSDQWFSPIQFAKENYKQYPAFNVPFHPPGYPGMLGLVFLSTGVSYLASRLFVAVCAGAAASFFFMILRSAKVPRWPALGCSLLMLTTPEIARWSRCTMSECPSLAFIMAASYCFYMWVQRDRLVYCLAAFALAEVAFMCRVTTAGVLPAWFLYVIFMGKTRHLLSRPVMLCSLSYLAINASFVVWASQFARHEVGALVVTNVVASSGLNYMMTIFPQIALWGTAIVGVVGLAYTLICRHAPVGMFWLSWLISYTIFKLAIPTTLEIRHYYGALPALAGLAACLFVTQNHQVWRGRLATGLLVVGLAINGFLLTKIPPGMVGYDVLSERMSELDRLGNVLLCCPEEQELIFRFRSATPGSKRQMIRGNRTLAVRMQNYSEEQTQILAHTADDFLEVVRKGRVRYLVTSTPAEGSSAENTFEMKLADRVARERPDLFHLVEQRPFFIQIHGNDMLSQVYLWEYLGKLPDGPSELPIVIPTANIHF